MGGDPRSVHTDAVSSSPIARPCSLRDRVESSCGSGHNPATLWVTELVVSLKTTAPTTSNHRVLAALAATAVRCLVVA